MTKTHHNTALMWYKKDFLLILLWASIKERVKLATQNGTFRSHISLKLRIKNTYYGWIRHVSEFRRPSQTRMRVDERWEARVCIRISFELSWFGQAMMTVWCSRVKTSDQMQFSSYDLMKRRVYKNFTTFFFICRCRHVVSSQENRMVKSQRRSHGIIPR